MMIVPQVNKDTFAETRRPDASRQQNCSDLVFRANMPVIASWAPTRAHRSEARVADSPSNKREAQTPMESTPGSEIGWLPLNALEGHGHSWVYHVFFRKLRNE